MFRNVKGHVLVKSCASLSAATWKLHHFKFEIAEEQIWWMISRIVLCFVNWEPGDSSFRLAVTVVIPSNADILIAIVDSCLIEIRVSSLLHLPTIAIKFEPHYIPKHFEGRSMEQWKPAQANCTRQSASYREPNTYRPKNLFVDQQVCSHYITFL